MNFDLLAKNLLRSPTNESYSSPKGGKTLERAGALVELAESGFGRKEVFEELRFLYDGAEDDILKKQLLEMVVKIHGLYKDDERKESPIITFTVIGDPIRFQNMLAPPPPTAVMVNEQPEGLVA
jgi:hypothetical protein